MQICLQKKMISSLIIILWWFLWPTKNRWSKVQKYCVTPFIGIKKLPTWKVEWKWQVVGYSVQSTITAWVLMKVRFYLHFYCTVMFVVIQVHLLGCISHSLLISCIAILPRFDLAYAWFRPNLFIWLKPWIFVSGWVLQFSHLLRKECPLGKVDLPVFTHLVLTE